MLNNGDSRLLQQFFIRKIISVKVGSPRDIEIVQISGKITPVGFNLSCYSVFVSALHMNMICVDGSKVLASKEDCLIITAISSLFEPRTV